jgi:methionine-rich copper-binding protein CopC
MRRTAFLVIAGLAVLGQGLPARAHAERSASTPKEGATVGAAPASLRITFTEPPTGNAVVQVLDGCERDVVADVEVQNFEITADLSAGQPGTWTVQSNVISAVDGHNTRDRWTFGVRGEPDCTATGDDGPAAGDETEDEGGGGAMLLIALGGGMIVLVAVALVLRGRSS